MTNEVNTISQPLQPSTRMTRSEMVAKATAAEKDAPLEDTEEPKEIEPPSNEPVEEMVVDLNKMAQQLRRELRFSTSEDSGEIIIKVIDKETDEVIRQIPSEEVQEMRKRLSESAGIIFRDSA